MKTGALGASIVRWLWLTVAAYGICGGVLAQQSAGATREVPARVIPVPTTVSPQMAKLIARPATEARAPQSSQEWKSVVHAAAAEDLARIAELRKQFAVTVEALRLGGVPCYRITPVPLPERNRHRVLLHLHGGAYVFGPGEAGTLEAIAMAGFGHGR